MATEISISDECRPALYTNGKFALPESRNILLRRLPERDRSVPLDVATLRVLFELVPFFGLCRPAGRQVRPPWREPLAVRIVTLALPTVLPRGSRRARTRTDLTAAEARDDRPPAAPTIHHPTVHPSRIPGDAVARSRTPDTDRTLRADSAVQSSAPFWAPAWLSCR